MKLIGTTIFSFVNIYTAIAQTANITGKIVSDGKPVELANINLAGTRLSATTDSFGVFSIVNIPNNTFKIRVSCIGYDDFEKWITLRNGDKLTVNIVLNAAKTTLNEVVVTGVSKATLIRENPVAIVGISSKSIEQTNESNIIDVLVKNAPGLHAVKTGPNISKPFIRGLGYNRVLTLYDGIRQEGQQWGDEHGIEVDAYNIDKAEVIKGPASLMFGSDALAGVVSLFPFVSSTDDGKWHGKFLTEYQSNNGLIGNGLRFNYSDKHFLLVTRGSVRIAKNYFNPVDGRVYNTNFFEKNISALVGYKSSRGYSHLNFTLYDNLQGIPDGSRDSLTRKFTKQIYESDKDTVNNRPVVSDDELNAYLFSPLHQHIQHYRIYMHNSYRLGNGDIDMLLALQQNIRKEYNHPTMPAQPGMFVRLNTLNYGLRYNVPKFLNIETSVGINGMLQNNKNINATDFPIPDYNLHDGGAYMYAKWKYNKWSISGGVRYDIRQIQWKNFYVKTNPITGLDEQVYSSDTATANLQFPAYKKIFGGISASIGATFQLTKQVSIKANIGRGYRAPNITEMASNGLDPGAHIIYIGNRGFNPEFSLQEDIGAGLRCNNVSAELNLFNNNIQNYIYLSLLADANGNAIVDAQGNKTYQYQQASAQLYGMEASIAFHPEKIKGFSFDNSFTTVYGFNRKAIYKEKGIMGEYLPLMPPAKMLSSITQKIQMRSGVFSTLTPKIEIEYNAAQERFLGLNETETYTASYLLLNAGIVTEIKYLHGQKIQLQLQVNNLFDEVYQSGLNRLKYFEHYSQSPNGYLGMYNMGRNICFKMIVPI